MDGCAHFAGAGRDWTAAWQRRARRRCWRSRAGCAPCRSGIRRRHGDRPEVPRRHGRRDRQARRAHRGRGQGAEGPAGVEGDARRRRPQSRRSPSKAAFAALKLVPVEGEELAFPDDADALRSLRPSNEAGAALVGSIDNLVHQRRELESLVEPADLKRIPREGRAGGALPDLPSHAILEGGSVAGLWEYDVEKEQIVAGVFGRITPAVKKAIAATEEFVR